LEFEARKAAVHILCILLQGNGGAEGKVVEYVRSRPNMVQQILGTCIHAEAFFLGSQIIRSAARSQQLVSVLLENGSMLQLLRYVFHPEFEISNEVFAAFREIVLSQKCLASAHIDCNFDTFFELYHPLLEHDNYVVQRQALKFLGQLLLDPDFQCIMLKYVQNARFLQIHMNLLREKSQTIPFDAFHIFKVFVANPDKPAAIRNILCRNGKRLISLLASLRHRNCDDDCREDLDVVIDVIGEMVSQ